MNVLAIHPGALGDIILSLPALRRLRHAFPDSSIALAANLDFAEAVTHGCADRLISFSSLPLHSLYSEAPPTDEAIRIWQSFDRIISWTGSADQAFAAKFAGIHPAVIVRSWKPDPDDSRHVSQIFVDSLRPWIQSEATLLPARIELNPEMCQSGLDWLRLNGWTAAKPLVVVHPGAGSPNKRWPMDHFVCLASQLRSRYDVLVIEGPAEPGFARDLAGRIGKRTLCAAGLPLTELASILAQAALFIGNDSGIAHLAAGLEIPSYLFFGPSSPIHWTPLGIHVRVLRKAESCRACSENPCEPHTCLSAISPEEAFEAVQHLLVNPDYS